VSESRVYARHPRRRGAVLIVGTGAVGGFLAEELARLGVSPLRLVDREVLELENLIRHPLGDSDVGQPKASALARQIRHEFPVCDAIGIDADFMELPTDEQFRLASEANLVVAATDSVDCQRRVNEICVAAEVTAVYPGIWVSAHVREGEVGEILWVRPDPRTPCYLCAMSWRTEGATAGARGHTRSDIQVLVSATVAVVAGLLDPRDERARLLDNEETLILVHGFMPTSDEVQDFFAGRIIGSVEVPFPPIPCPACGGQESHSRGPLSEETAQALVRALEAAAERLGEDGPFARLEQRLAEMGLQDAGSISSELVRVAAELGELQQRLPSLREIEPAIASLGRLSEHLSEVTPTVELSERFATLLRATLTELRPYQDDLRYAVTVVKGLPRLMPPKDMLERLDRVVEFLERVAGAWGYSDSGPGSGG
jgi:hypothetical protein